MYPSDLDRPGRLPQQGLPLTHTLRIHKVLQVSDHWHCWLLSIGLFCHMIGHFDTVETLMHTSRIHYAYIRSFDSLTTGAVAVATVGPLWDSASDDPPYRGTLLGSNAQERTGSSVQFDILQNLMESDAKIAFNFYTAKRIESRQTETEETRLLNGLFTDPCTTAGATFGIFDMVACDKAAPGDPDLTGPAALVYDEPIVIHELNGRFQRTGTCSLVSVGYGVEPMGYGLGFPYSSAATDVFSRAIHSSLYTGSMTRYKARYRLRTQDLLCMETPPEGGDVMDIRGMSGLFVSVGVFLVFTVIFSYFEKPMQLAHKEAGGGTGGLTLKQRRKLAARLAGKRKNRENVDDEEDATPGLISADGIINHEQLVEFFRKYDTDQSGGIDVHELEARMHPQTHAQMHG